MQRYISGSDAPQAFFSLTWKLQQNKGKQPTHPQTKQNGEEKNKQQKAPNQTKNPEKKPTKKTTKKRKPQERRKAKAFFQCNFITEVRMNEAISCYIQLLGSNLGSKNKRLFRTC